MLCPVSGAVLFVLQGMYQSKCASSSQFKYLVLIISTRFLPWLPSAWWWFLIPGSWQALVTPLLPICLFDFEIHRGYFVLMAVYSSKWAGNKTVSGVPNNSYKVQQHCPHSEVRSIHQRFYFHLQFSFNSFCVRAFLLFPWATKTLMNWLFMVSFCLGGQIKCFYSLSRKSSFFVTLVSQ